MKSLILLTLVTTLAAASAALARVGETRAQVQARYGLPDLIMDPDELGNNQARYSFNEFTITIAFVNGRSERERYWKNGQKPLLDEEITLLLAANVGEGTTWKMEKKHLWKRSDGKMVAVFFGDFLDILTTSYDDALRTGRTKKENDKLKGF
jgi:hypothetical protein